MPLLGENPSFSSAAVNPQSGNMNHVKRGFALRVCNHCFFAHLYFYNAGTEFAFECSQTDTACGSTPSTFTDTACGSTPSSCGTHVTRDRSWWKRGDASACTAQTTMECWVHQDIILQDDKANQSLKEAWEQEDKKDEFKIDLHGHERFWLGTEAGHLGCYDFPGETWAGDGSAHKGGVGAGSVCLQQQDKCLVTGPSGPRRGGSQLTRARTGSSGSDTAGHTTRDQSVVLV